MAVEENLGSASIDIDVLLGPLRKSLDEAKGITQSTLDDAGEKSGRSMGSRIVSGVGAGVAAIGKVVAAATVAGTVALAGLGIAGVKAGLDTASAMEQAEISFTTMLGSAEAAQDFLGKMRDFAAKTPFEFPELQTAASSLISAGVEADKVIPIMTSLGNATSGMGTGSEGVKRATIALQQMSAAGRITGEDLNQLRDAGVPVFDLLAAATGKSKEEVAELAQKGKLGKTEMLQLFEALETGKGLERFNGLMEAQSASLAGMMSTLRDTVGMGLSRVVAPWLPTIKQAVGEIAAAAEPAFAWLEAKSTELAVHGPAALAKVKEAGQQLWAVIVKVKGGVDQFVAGLQGKGPIDGFSGALNTAGLGLRALVLAFQDGDVTSDGFVGAMETVGVALRTVYDFVTQVFDGLKSGDTSQVSDAFSSIGESLTTLAPVFSEFLSQLPSLSDVLGVVATALSWLADHSDTLLAIMPLLVLAFAAMKLAVVANTIATAAGIPVRLLEVAVMRQQAVANSALAFQLQVLTGVQQRSRIATIASTIATRAQAAATAIWTGITKSGIIVQQLQALATYGQSTAWGTLTATQRIAVVTQKLVTAAQWAWNAALNANPIALVIIAIAALVAGLVWFFTQTELGREVIGKVWAAIQIAIAVAKDWILGTALPAILRAWDALWTGTQKVFTAIKGWILNRVADIVGVAVRIIAFKDQVVANFEAMKAAVILKVTQFVDNVKALPGRILDAIGNLGSLLLDKGRNLVEGLWNGINNARQWLKDKIMGFVTDAIPGPIADALGIASPSKVAAKLTRWVPRGMAGGMLAEIGVVRSASLALAAAAIAGPMMLTVPTVGTSMAAPVLAGAVAATSAATRGDGATAAAASGPLVEQHIHPRENQSEQAIGDAAMSNAAWHLRAGGGPARG